MNILKKKWMAGALALLLSPYSVLGAVSVTVPTPNGGAIHYGDRDHYRDREWKRNHHPRHEHRKVCKKTCRWSEYHGHKICRVYCRPAAEGQPWRH